MQKKSTNFPHSVGSHSHDPQGRGLTIIPLSTRTVSERGASRLRGVPSGLRVRRRRGAGLWGGKERGPSPPPSNPGAAGEYRRDRLWTTKRAPSFGALTYLSCRPFVRWAKRGTPKITHGSAGRKSLVHPRPLSLLGRLLDPSWPRRFPRWGVPFELPESRTERIPPEPQGLFQFALRSPPRAHGFEIEIDRFPESGRFADDLRRRGLGRIDRDAGRFPEGGLIHRWRWGSRTPHDRNPSRQSIRVSPFRRTVGGPIPTTPCSVE